MTQYVLFCEFSFGPVLKPVEDLEDSRGPKSWKRRRSESLVIPIVASFYFSECWRLPWKVRDVAVLLRHWRTNQAAWLVTVPLQTLCVRNPHLYLSSRIAIGSPTNRVRGEYMAVAAAIMLHPEASQPQYCWIVFSIRDGGTPV